MVDHELESIGCRSEALYLSEGVDDYQGTKAGISKIAKSYWTRAVNRR